MPNMLDYLTWRGDLPLGCVPWNEVDSLLMSERVWVSARRISSSLDSSSSMDTENNPERHFSDSRLG